MKMRLAIAAILIGATVDAEHPIETLRSGLTLGRTNQYAEAADLFAAAATNATAAGLDPSVAVYDEALARLKAGAPEKAAERFGDAMRTDNAALRRDAYINRASSMMEISEQQEKSEKVDQAIKSVREAQTMLKQAIELDRSDIDAKTNYELALRREQELINRPKPPPKQDQDKKDNDNDKQKPPPEQDQQQQQQPSPDQKKSNDDKQQQPQDKQDQQQDKDQKPSEPKDQQGKDQDKQEQREAKAGEDQRPAEQMTPEEATALLDAMRKAEEAQREKARTRNARVVPVEKDW